MGLLGGLLGRLGAILGVLERSLAVFEASWSARVCFLGRHGSLGEPQGGAMAAQGPPVIGAVQSSVGVGGAVPQKTTETLPDSTWHSSTPQCAGGGTVADCSRPCHVSSRRWSGGHCRHTCLPL